MKIKKICIYFLILTIILSFFSICFADDNFDITSFETATVSSEKIENLTRHSVESVLGVIRIVASGVLVIIAVIIASKYMIASAGERADIKKYAVAFVIAALIIFGSTFIVQTLVDLSESISS